MLGYCQKACRWPQAPTAGYFNAVLNCSIFHTRSVALCTASPERCLVRAVLYKTLIPKTAWKININLKEDIKLGHDRTDKRIRYKVQGTRETAFDVGLGINNSMCT